MMNKITQIAAELSTYLQKYEEKIKETFLDEKIVDELFDDVESEVKKYLTVIFGAENDTNCLGILGDILPYYHPEIEKEIENELSDAVLFSYWTFQGERDNYAPESHGNWRENCFYKGRRWSNEVLKKQFYDYFKLITEAIKETDAKAPVNFFTNLGFNSKTLYFRLLTMNSSKPDDMTIVLPTAEQLLDLNLDKTKQIVNRIKAWRKYVSFPRMRKTIDVALQTCSDLPENVKQLLLESAEELSNTELINKVKNNIEHVFFNKRPIPISNRDIALVILAFIYYDNPYDIHFYLPEPLTEPVNGENNNSPESVLIITVKQGLTEIDKYKQKFLELSTALRGLHKIEKLILERWKKSLPIYWQWKKNYESMQKKYERMSGIAINLCKAVCDKYDIPYAQIPYRVKTFESFYHKILKVANCDTEIDEEKIKKEEFRKAIKNAREKDLDYICNELRDIAGVRIVLIYADDIMIIKKEFELMKRRNEINYSPSDEKDYTQAAHSLKDPLVANVFDYRGYHLTFVLGAARQNLYECYNLNKIRCEIQIKTILADGWSQVSHELFYKPELAWKHLSAKQKQEILSKFNATSAMLFSADQDWVELRNSLPIKSRKHIIELE